MNKTFYRAQKQMLQADLAIEKVQKLVSKNEFHEAMRYLKDESAANAIANYYGKDTLRTLFSQVCSYMN